MRPSLSRPALLATLALAPCCWAQAPPPTTAPATVPTTPTSAGSVAQQPVWQPDNRLILGGSYQTLTGTSGGESGTIGFLGQLNPRTLIGIAGDYESLAGSSWEFGSLSGAYSHALTSDTRWNVHAEAHEGAGETGPRHWDYSIVAGGGGFTMPIGLTLDLEERQIDVDTSHGSLPKVGLSQSWGTQWLTSVAYAKSLAGNLDTEYGLLRIDFYAHGFNLLAGGSYGRVNPTVINIDGVLTPESRHLREVFGGVTAKAHPVDLTLLADSIDLVGIEHFTVTLSATVHL